MKGKDTVMGPEDIWRIQGLVDRHLELLLEAQAEISFKAGMKEVVQELTHYTGSITLAQLGATNRWQAKLKEWGL